MAEPYVSMGGGMGGGYMSMSGVAIPLKKNQNQNVATDNHTPTIDTPDTKYANQCSAAMDATEAERGDQYSQMLNIPGAKGIETLANEPSSRVTNVYATADEIEHSRTKDRSSQTYDELLILRQSTMKQSDDVNKGPVIGTPVPRKKHNQTKLAGKKVHDRNIEANGKDKTRIDNTTAAYVKTSTLRIFLIGFFVGFVFGVATCSVVWLTADKLNGGNVPIYVREVTVKVPAEGQTTTKCPLHMESTTPLQTTATGATGTSSVTSDTRSTTQ